MSRQSQCRFHAVSLPVSANVHMGAQILSILSQLSNFQSIVISIDLHATYFTRTRIVYSNEQHHWSNRFASLTAMNVIGPSNAADSPAFAALIDIASAFVFTVCDGCFPSDDV